MQKRPREYRSSLWRCSLHPLPAHRRQDTCRSDLQRGWENREHWSSGVGWKENKLPRLVEREICSEGHVDSLESFQHSRQKKLNILHVVSLTKSCGLGRAKSEPGPGWWLCPGLESQKAKPKPWLSGQARPEHHYSWTTLLQSLQYYTKIHALVCLLQFATSKIRVCWCIPLFVPLLNFFHFMENSMDNTSQEHCHLWAAQWGTSESEDACKLHHYWPSPSMSRWQSPSDV